MVHLFSGVLQKPLDLFFMLYFMGLHVFGCSEEELVAALRVPGELTSPASKNHSESKL